MPSFLFFFQAEDGIRDDLVTGVQTCALPISRLRGLGGTLTLETNVVVPAGGQFDLDASAQNVVLRGVLTNRGSMKWVTQFNTFDLSGSGRVENRSEERRVGKECRARGWGGAV